MAILRIMPVTQRPQLVHKAAQLCLTSIKVTTLLPTRNFSPLIQPQNQNRELEESIEESDRKPSFTKIKKKKPRGSNLRSTKSAYLEKPESPLQDPVREDEGNAVRVSRPVFDENGSVFLRATMLYPSEDGPVYQNSVETDECSAVRASEPNFGENARDASQNGAVRTGTQVVHLGGQDHARINISGAHNTPPDNGLGNPNSWHPKHKWYHVNQIMKDNKIGILVVGEAHLSASRHANIISLFGRRLDIRFSEDPVTANVKGVALHLIRDKELKEFIDDTGMQMQDEIERITAEGHERDPNFNPQTQGSEEDCKLGNPARCNQRLAKAQVKKHHDSRLSAQVRNRLEGEIIGSYWSALNRAKKPREMIRRLLKPGHDPLGDATAKYETYSKRMATIVPNYHNSIQKQRRDTTPDIRDPTIDIVLQSPSTVARSRAQFSLGRHVDQLIEPMNPDFVGVF
ncbi:hypothetical protein B0H13DRAFT_1851316 [Mycena leptocephala]|nr:hypothetical protein B0H13DRAFT_1851316 [Mycena leptocephala]